MSNPTPQNYKTKKQGNFLVGMILFLLLFMGLTIAFFACASQADAKGLVLGTPYDSQKSFVSGRVTSDYAALETLDGAEFYPLNSGDLLTVHWEDESGTKYFVTLEVTPCVENPYPEKYVTDSNSRLCHLSGWVDKNSVVLD